MVRSAGRPGLGARRLGGGDDALRRRRRLRLRRLRVGRRLAGVRRRDGLRYRADGGRGGRRRGRGHAGAARVRLRRRRRADSGEELGEALCEGMGRRWHRIRYPQFHLLRVPQEELLELSLVQDHRQLVVVEEVHHGVLEKLTEGLVSSFLLIRLLPK